MENATIIMSKLGYPYDNAPMKRYFNALKAELINIHAYVWHNNQRPNSFNRGLLSAKVA